MFTLYRWPCCIASGWIQPWRRVSFLLFHNKILTCVQQQQHMYPWNKESSGGKTFTWRDRQTEMHNKHICECTTLTHSFVHSFTHHWHTSSRLKVSLVRLIYVFMLLQHIRGSNEKRRKRNTNKHILWSSNMSNNNNNSNEMSQAKRTTSATRDEAPNQQQQQQTHIVDKEITRINNGNIYENSETYDNLENIKQRKRVVMWGGDYITKFCVARRHIWDNEEWETASSLHVSKSKMS